MITASTELKNKIFTSTTLLANVTITLTDNTVITLDNSGIMSGGLTIKQSQSSNSRFEVGTVNASSLTLQLVNFDNRYETTDFTDAQIVVRIGAELSETTEYVNKGVYFVDKQTFSGGVVTLVAYDKIADFDSDYSGNLTGAAYQLLYNIATKYAIGINYSKMNNPNTVITIPSSDDTTYTDREIVSYICQITGNNAFMNNVGQLVIKWYDVDKIDNFSFIAAHQEDEDKILAGVFEDMEDVVVCIEAGEFEDIGSGVASNPLIVTTIFGIPTIGREDVVITGAKFSTMDGTEVLSGTDDYCIEVKDNPLATGNESTYAALLAGVVVGNTFRTVTLKTVKNPLIESGDVAIIQYKNRLYATIFTNVEFKIGSNLSLVCGAETPGYNTAVKSSEAAKVYKKSVQKTESLISTYDATMQALTNLMAMSFGVYKIEETLSDGSKIFYMASKPTLAESYGSSVWKMTANTFTVTDDYQGDNTQWRAGVDSQGNFVVNILSAIGINFDWARGGTLSLGGYNNTNGVLNVYDENNTQIGYWNNTGIHLNKGSISINNNFSVNSSGNLTATNATVQGTITADSGSIGLWTIEPNSGATKGGLVYENDDIGEIDPVKYLYMRVGNPAEGSPMSVIDVSASNGLYMYSTSQMSSTPVYTSRIKPNFIKLTNRTTGGCLYMFADDYATLAYGTGVDTSAYGINFLRSNGSTTDLGVNTTAYMNGVRVVCQSSQPAAVSGKTIVWIQT